MFIEAARTTAAQATDQQREIGCCFLDNRTSWKPRGALQSK
jgi:hypothetical protein